MPQPRTAPGLREKRISAMVRVRNEEEFLAVSVRSIADHVDEVLLVDNLSSDATPDVIRSLADAYPEKVVAHRYPHEIRRVGRENWELLGRDKGASSPHLSANYYNWCLERCSHSHVLKWDADMVALERFTARLSRWRRSEAEVLVFHGVNVHPNRRNGVAARCSDRATLLESLSVPALPLWATSLSTDFPEPRLFPRARARYESRNRWTQSLASPFLEAPLADRCVERIEDPCFLHLKFCKREPLAGYSSDLADVIAGNVALGRSLDEEMRATLRRHGI
jgi:hypothetical protein